MGIIPILLLNAARRHGDQLPAFSCGWYAHPLIQGLIVLVFASSGSTRSPRHWGCCPPVGDRARCLRPGRLLKAHAWSFLDMPQSIRHLIALPELRSRLLSGAGGLDRPVRWAHVCELDDPTEWLGEGDLLMTTGLGIPSEAERQRRYIRRLAEAGLAGMMIGENMEAPSDLDALRETAEALGFPLILTHYGVPFAAVTRAIVDAGQKDEYERRNALADIRKRPAEHAGSGPAGAAATPRQGRAKQPLPHRSRHPGGLAARPARAARGVGRRAAQPPSRAGGAAADGPSPSARGRRSAQHRHSFRPELPADSPGRAAAGLQSPAPPDGSARHRDRTAARRKRTPPAPGFGIARRPAATTAIPGTSRGAAGGTAARLDLDDAVVSMASSEGLATDPIGLSGATTHACWFARRARKSFCCTRPASPRSCRKPWTARWA